MIIEDVMDDIGDRLNTIPNLNVHPYEADSINVPAAIVSLPADMDYKGAYQAGLDKFGLIVTILVSLVDDRVRRHEIAPYGDSSGSRSIRQVLETGTYTAFDYIAVTKGQFEVISLEGIEYLGATFTVNVGGRGSS